MYVYCSLNNKLKPFLNATVFMFDDRGTVKYLQRDAVKSIYTNVSECMTCAGHQFVVAVSLSGHNDVTTIKIENSICK